MWYQMAGFYFLNLQFSIFGKEKNSYFEDIDFSKKRVEYWNFYNKENSMLPPSVAKSYIFLKCKLFCIRKRFKSLKRLWL